MNRPKLKFFSPSILGDQQPNARLALLILLASLCLLQFLRTFMRWPDPLIDFGRELYVPWQLAEGKSLIRDVPYFQGPLSPWLNALWFKLFGVGIATLAKVNLVIFLFIVFLLFDLLEKIADRFAAFWACFLVVAVFGFGQYMTTANYNFITPYAHEITHGMLLCLLALLAAQRFLQTPHSSRAIWLGLVIGTLFLTKPEMFLAGITGVAGVLGYGSYSGRLGGRAANRLLYALLAFLAPPVFAFFTLLSASEGYIALRGVLGGFTQLLESRVTANPFQAWVSGFDDVPGNLISVLAMTTLWAATLSLGWIVHKWQSSSAETGSLAKLLALAGFFCLLFAANPHIPYEDLPRAFPVLGLVLLVLLRPGSLSALAKAVPEDARPLAFGFALFGMAMMARIILKVGFVHYGFAFALPISTMLVAALGCWIPRLMQRSQGDGMIARFFTIYVVLAFSFVFYRIDLSWSISRIFPVVERAEDAILVDEAPARVFGAIGQAIKKFMRPGDSLVVIPEGVMINYLHRLEAPVGYTSLLPIVFDIFGEQNILGRFRATPPDFILYYYMSGAEWGKPDFGIDYGVELGAFVRENYKPVWRAGAPPFDGSGLFGVELLRRK